MTTPPGKRLTRRNDECWLCWTRGERALVRVGQRVESWMLCPEHRDEASADGVLVDVVALVREHPDRTAVELAAIVPECGWLDRRLLDFVRSGQLERTGRPARYRVASCTHTP